MYLVHAPKKVAYDHELDMLLAFPNNGSYLKF